MQKVVHVTVMRDSYHHTTGPTEWVERSRFLVFLVVCFHRIGVVRKFFVGVRVCMTIFFVVVTDGTTGVVLDLVFLLFELTALVSIVTWFFEAVASWFGFVWVFLCGLLRHSHYLQITWSFQTIQFELLFKMGHNLFICAILQMCLINFFQVRRYLVLIWSAQWSLDRQLRIYHSLVFGVRLENLLTSGSQGWRPVVENCVLL